MPMAMQQPALHDLTAPTQMLPNMPTVAQRTHVSTVKVSTANKASTASKKQATGTEAVRAAKAKITRRNSLKKQRSAQKKRRFS
jgi:hypothetical protein